MRLTPIMASILTVLLLVGGCPPENYPTLAPATLNQANQITGDTTLTPQQRRLQLASLGLDPVTINTLMQSVRTANQFGGDLRSAYNKVVAPNFIALTPDEVQIYGDEATNLDSTLSFTISDAEAAAIVNFFNDNDLTSKDLLKTYLDDPANEVPSAITKADLQSLFIDFDPQRVLPDLP